jgi:hypothetical protein
MAEERVLFSLIAVEGGPKHFLWQFGGSVGSSLPQEKRQELIDAFGKIMEPQFREWDREATKYQ